MYVRTSAYDKAIGRIPHPVSTDWIVFYDRGVAEELRHGLGAGRHSRTRAAPGRSEIAANSRVSAVRIER